MKTEVLQKPTQKIRTVYLDYLKVLATFAVVIVHATSGSWSLVEPYSSDFVTLKFYNNLFSWTVPIFVMISGALFLNPNKPTSLSMMLKKYILRLSTSYIFWSFLNALINAHTEDGIIDIIIYTLKGHSIHWFIPMLVGLYLITPMLKAITASKKRTIYFLVLFILFAIAIPQILNIASISLQGTGFSSIVDSIKSTFDNTNFHFTLGYSGYYVLGYFLHTFEIRKPLKNFLFISGFTSFAVAIFLAFVNIKDSSLHDVLHHNFAIRVFCESTFVFIFIKQLNKKIFLRSSLDKFITWIAKNSFGIYLSHIIVLRLLKNIGLSVITFNPIFAVPLISLCAFSICFITSVLLRKIPKIGKYIV